MRALGVRFGMEAVYLPALIKPKPAGLRALLVVDPQWISGPAGPLRPGCVGGARYRRRTFASTPLAAIPSSAGGPSGSTCWTAWRSRSPVPRAKDRSSSPRRCSRLSGSRRSRPVRYWAIWATARGTARDGTRFARAERKRAAAKRLPADARPVLALRQAPGAQGSPHDRRRHTGRQVALVCPAVQEPDEGEPALPGRDGSGWTDGSIRKADHRVAPGDVLTVPTARDIRVVRVLAVGTRRGPPAEARSLYETVPPARAGAP